MLWERWKGREKLITLLMALPATVFRSWFKWSRKCTEEISFDLQSLRRNKNVPGRARLMSYLPISSFWKVSESGTHYTCPWHMPGPLCCSTLTVCVCVCMCVCVTRMGKLPCSAELILEEGGAASLQSHTHEIVTIWQVEKIKTCRNRRLKYLCWKYK